MTAKKNFKFPKKASKKKTKKKQNFLMFFASARTAEMWDDGCIAPQSHSWTEGSTT
jgi:hypothetical protein